MDFFELASDEKIKKEYHAVTLGKFKGYLIVTNRRVIFNMVGEGLFHDMNSIQSIHMDQIKGTDVYYSKRWSLPELIIGLLVFSLSFSLYLVTILSGQQIYMFWAVLSTIIGGIILYLSLRREFNVKIKAKKVSDIEIGAKKILSFRQFIPGEDAKSLAKEIEALILEIQSMDEEE